MGGWNIPDEGSPESFMSCPLSIHSQGSISGLHTLGLWLLHKKKYQTGLCCEEHGNGQ